MRRRVEGTDTDRPSVCDRQDVSLDVQLVPPVVSTNFTEAPLLSKDVTPSLSHFLRRLGNNY